MKFRTEERPKVRASLDLTPLIDVVFQLLLFFMLSSTFVVQTSVPIKMPKAEGATTLENKDVTITITKWDGDPDVLGGLFFTKGVDQVAIESWEQLTELLIAAKQDNPDIIVLIRCDEGNRFGRFTQVIGVTSSVGISRFSIAAEPPNEGE